MIKFKKENLNKVLIIVASLLAVIAVVIAIIFFVSKDNKEEKVSYEDNITTKNYFSEITIDIEKKIVKRDSETTTLQDEFGISEGREALVLSSTEELNNFFMDSTFDVEIKEGIAYVTNKYQTKKILVQTNETDAKFNSTENVEELQNGIYILSYDTQKRTKEAYEHLRNVEWINKVELDEVMKVNPIPDESQTVYNGEENNSEERQYKSYGVKAMGLDNYQKIIEENGNSAEIVIATVGYGAAINNSYFGGRISDKSHNFIEDSNEIYETIPQGSRILEVIQESTTHNVKFMPLVVVNRENYTTLVSIVKAIEYAIQNSDVICYEMVHNNNYFIDTVLKDSFQKNIPVCAVTTSTVDEEKNYPANNSTTIAVTSLDKSAKITNYSGSGEYIDFSAYSTDIEEIFNTSSSVSKWSGAEYSNAHIVSAIALIKTYHKGYTILEIYNVLRNYCKDLGEEGKDKNYGYGCPDFSNLKISDIDKTAPQMGDIVFDNEKWEKGKKIQIKANDEIRILGWSVTNNEEEPKEWNKLDVLSSKLEVTYDLDKNGKYYIWVTDSAGNKVNKSIDVNRIDNVGPKIEYTVDTSKQNTEKYVTITVKAVDEESGLNDTAFSWDGLAWGKDNYQLKVTENGKYTINVRDNMENITKKEIEVNSFPQEGKAEIEDGSLIKSIDVSSDWNGDTNNSVKITFNDNLKIANWKITESLTVPEGFETVENNNVDLDYEDEQNGNNVNTNEINEALNNTGLNVFLDNTTIADAYATSVNVNRPSNTISSSQGYANMTITISLKVDKQYYVWVKDNEGNVMSQGFKITK